MKASNNAKISITGTVKKALLNEGSRNEHVGFILETKTDQYRLRRLKENPFSDDFFLDYLNKTITIEGFVHNNQLFVQSIESTD
ncbi:MAG: hypothetical protein HYZ14_07425 [Bacteroidetes bacterium]|nr:hypothetical protein [Bacteroidota bacterium]